MLGLGPIGQICARIAQHRGARAIGIDLVPSAARWQGASTVSRSWISTQHERPGRGAARRPTDADPIGDRRGRHGSARPPRARRPRSEFVGLLPDRVAATLMEGRYRSPGGLHARSTLVRRGGTISISGVYGGMIDPMPMLQLFDKGVTLRMGKPTSTGSTTSCRSCSTDPIRSACSISRRTMPLDEAPGGIRDVPGEEGRRDQSCSQALTGSPCPGSTRADPALVSVIP